MKEAARSRPAAAEIANLNDKIGLGFKYDFLIYPETNWALERLVIRAADVHLRRRQ